MADPGYGDMTAPARAGPERLRGETPIVPRHSIAGGALLAVIAIMTFLVCLTTGAVLLVQDAARAWQADLAREVTVQIRPLAGRDIEADVQAAVALLRAVRGIDEVRPYSRQEAARLLEPWLGQGLVLDDLPVPRLIRVRLAAGARPDWDGLRRQLAEKIPGASLDDHRGWIARMQAMAGTALAGGILVLVLMMAATLLCVTFATRGAMAANRPVIEVLHFIGARNRFIARHFQRHFLLLGLQGGLIGGFAAIALFAFAQLWSAVAGAGAGEDTVSALFGRFSLGLSGYAALVLEIMLIAALTGLTARITVHHTLETVE